MSKIENSDDISIEDYIADVLGIELQDDVGYFTGDDFRTAIIGTDINGCLVYSYEKMVEYYIEAYDCTEEEAREWIDYNTIRTVGYMGIYPPVIVYEVMR